MLKAQNKKLAKLYFRLANARVVFTLGATYVINQLLIIVILGEYGQDLLRLQTTFDPELFRRILSEWEGAGFAAYKKHFYPDCMHPLIYSFFLASAWAFFTRREGAYPSPGVMVMFVLPFVAGFCDLVENALHLLMISDLEHIPTYMVKAGALVANTKWLLSSVSILVTLVAYWRYAMRKREVFTEISILADPIVIWEILTNLENYSQWNPFVVLSRGKAEVGARLECRPRMPGSKRILKFHPVVTRVVPQKEFAWHGHTLFHGLADGEHIFEFFPEEDGSIRLVHRQEFWGLAIPVVWRAIASKTEQGFDLMNRALKEKAEQRMKK
ncbi:MAG: SRPBCC domain-containing protein [Candidatus Magnetomorum sp.]|nr:SRPBCC domain-containing protein [Candidatus Magnetomorum sp.]